MTTKTSTLIEALSAAQGEMKNAAFDSKNNFSKNGNNNYASLSAIRDAVVPTLSNHGIAITQDVVLFEGERYMRTTLYKGGDKLEGMVPMIVERANMHGVGSAMTYARRYGLSSLVGITSDEDDDGDLAVANAPAHQLPSKITAKQASELTNEIERTQADLARFLEHFEIHNMRDLPSGLFQRAKQMLSERERKMIEKAAADAADAVVAAE